MCPTFPFPHLGDVVERLAGVVPDPALRIVQAVQHRRQEGVEVQFRGLGKISGSGWECSVAGGEHPCNVQPGAVLGWAGKKGKIMQTCRLGW